MVTKVMENIPKKAEETPAVDIMRRFCMEQYTPRAVTLRD